ncbi:queuine tRNA-ribosyltransferase [Blattabacterium sp. (Periplaneta americana) str. BPLAN]|uniref:tRNA guanosine(34) transglycosylase Tgt n=1 Tax=Blattabacterium sp. (Periplaneta americana) TaxID=367488 RepID=UPI0001BA0BE9|nr:tRNA guanosine(34) transglycosylase Tgt [Blattabacterium sp. (Periplaneta americana)]ACX83875.1 queuine tRNA-ribosyltransferase [Blattabacterium sp. (Periplaneta americana) str. BPLAN]
MKFNLIKTDLFSKARAGILETDHGKMETPIFMPVASKGSIKSIPTHELYDVGSKIILGNTYHLYFRPGIEVLHHAGGLHSFMNWKESILTDSGGFQVYSMRKSNKITENGVLFKSLINGSSHFFSPEKSMEIQRFIGGDMIMAFDDFPPYPCSYKEAKYSLEKTHLWLRRCYSYLKENPEKYDYKQSFFPIVQGSIYPDLRRFSAEKIALLEAEGNAIGGLSLGETKEQTQSITDIVTDILPKEKPRYLMGVGNPVDILEGIALGIDMFDCVLPTRNGRHGMLFTWKGIMNIKNKKWEKDFSCLDEYGNSYVDRSYSKSYVRHLFFSKENLAKQIASLHNLSFYLNLIKKARTHLLQETFYSWKKSVIPLLQERL